MLLGGCFRRPFHRTPTRGPRRQFRAFMCRLLPYFHRQEIALPPSKGDQSSIQVHNESSTDVSLSSSLSRRASRPFSPASPTANIVYPFTIALCGRTVLSTVIAIMPLLSALILYQVFAAMKRPIPFLTLRGCVTTRRAVRAVTGPLNQMA